MLIQKFEQKYFQEPKVQEIEYNDLQVSILGYLSYWLQNQILYTFVSK